MHDKTTMTAHRYIIHLGITDARSGSTIIEIYTQSITVSHIYLIIEALQTMLHRFKQTAVPYYTIMNDTINTLNVTMSELEGNTAYCTLSPNFQYHNASAIAEEFIGSMDEDTLDATIDMEVPIDALDSNSVVPFLYTVNHRPIFSYEIQSAELPNWNDVLRDLDLLMV
jgi:hypothetical protein